jgi:serine/threonine protein kinase
MDTLPYDEDEIPTRPTRDPSSPDFGGRYRILRRIGGGGAGDVYLGLQNIAGKERRVAIKIPKSSHSSDASSRRRFLEELHTLMELRHAHICEIIDGGEEKSSGRLFMVMAFADGGTLKDRAQASAGCRVEPYEAIRWLREAALGLQAAETHVNAKGEPAPVYHRDVKPANLLLQDGRVVVADFGAAKIGGDRPGLTTEDSPASWTAEYGSPEQSRRDPVDHRSDIYSLGASFYQLLTGELPQKRFASVYERFQEAHDPRSVIPELPRDLSALIRKMTEPEVGNRHQTFAEVVAEIDLLTSGDRGPKRSWLLQFWPFIGIVGAAVAGLFVWQNENGILVKGSGPGAIESLDYVEDLGTARTELNNEIEKHADLRKVGLSETLAIPLRMPLSELLECIDKANIEADRAETAPSRDLASRLRRGSSEIEFCRRNYDETAKLLQYFESKTREIESASVNELVAAAASKPLTRANQELDKVRDQFAKEVEVLRNRRKDLVSQLISRFTAGAVDLEDLRSSIEQQRSLYKKVDEIDLAERMDGLLASVGIAVDLTKRLGEWQPSDALVVRDIDSLNGRLRVADEIESEVSSAMDLSSWWNARRADRERAWVTLLLGAYSKLHLQLEIKIKGLSGMPPSPEFIEELNFYSDLRARWPSVVSAMRAKPTDSPQETPRLPVAAQPAVEAPAPVLAPLPEGWPDARFEPPKGIQSLALRPGEVEAERMFPIDFLKNSAKAKRRLWFLPKRKGLDDKPVYQAFLADPDGKTAALIDVHPVTFGEFRREDHRSSRVNSKLVQGAREKLPADTFLFDTMAKDAESFASSANDLMRTVGSVQYRLPPAGWRRWIGGTVTGPGPRASLEARPRLTVPFIDFAPCGLAFLASGVSEWVSPLGAEPTVEGVSEIARGDQGAPRRMDAGIRLAIWLQPR